MWRVVGNVGLGLVRTGVMWARSRARPPPVAADACGQGGGQGPACSRPLGRGGAMGLWPWEGGAGGGAVPVVSPPPCRLFFFF